MCSRDDDPTQHDIERPDSLATYDRLLNIQPRIDWQARIDEAICDVRAMAEALVFARSEIIRLKRENDRLRRALAEIATIDYRGNRSQESSMAYAALASEQGPLRKEDR